nr:MAG TPA: hypothetical protein [Caudoviricetes sp.]
MSCSSCGDTFQPQYVSKPCEKVTNCDDAIQLAYVPGTACTIGVTYNGITSTIALRQGIENCETDTKLMWNDATGNIDYHSERFMNHKEGALVQSVSAAQIASAINLCMLNDVSDTACDPENCSLLVYQKETSCGENCKGIDDMWAPWAAKNHKASFLHYVMGFNAEGCPIVLNTPSNKDKFWYAMWRSDNKFGYTQPQRASTLPKDEDGDPMVLSQNPETGAPIFAPLKVETDTLVFRTIARTTLIQEANYYSETHFELRIDSKEGNDGTMVAPDDMLVQLYWCSDYTGSTAKTRTFTVTVCESSENPEDTNVIRARARHFQNDGSDWAMEGSLSLVVHKGNFIKFAVQGEDTEHFRVHQVDATWTRLHTYREYRKD